MTDVLVFELIRVVICEVSAISLCLEVIIKHKDKKNFENVRYLLIGLIIFVFLFATLFEILRIIQILGYTV